MINVDETVLSNGESTARFNDYIFLIFSFYLSCIFSDVITLVTNERI